MVKWLVQVKWLQPKTNSDNKYGSDKKDYRTAPNPSGTLSYTVGYGFASSPKNIAMIKLLTFYCLKRKSLKKRSTKNPKNLWKVYQQQLS